MPTALSSAEAPPRTAGLVAEARRAIVDIRHLLWFRTVAVRRRGRTRLILGIVTLLTLAAAVGPAYLPDSVRTDERVLDVFVVLPTAFVGLLFLSVISGVASGGGRELLSRDHGVAYAVSPTTDHLGALLLAPLNVAWIIQAWTLLGAMAYAVGPSGLWGAQLVVLLWIVVATTAAQALAWAVESVRRTAHGEWIVRGVTALGGLLTAWLILTENVGNLLDALPADELLLVALGPAGGQWVRFGVGVAILVAIIPVLVALGAVAAHRAARRTPRDELRIESGIRSARPEPRSDLAALLRIDRASVWRVVPMRRGMTVLAVGPGLVAIAGSLDWASLTLLPGLVVSGAALLFGVNVWCLEGRGILWKESLPIDPGTVWDARVLVLLEWLLASSAITLLLGALRAGVPSGAELAAILCTWSVVTLQVVSASMRWSAARPFSVDLRSARATPAPPGVMVGYSARLALVTTLVGMIFSGLARLPVWEAAVLVAMPFWFVSCWRILRQRRAWLDPVQRVRIVSIVAG